jgi:hypothetical protein
MVEFGGGLLELGVLRLRVADYVSEIGGGTGTQIGAVRGDSRDREEQPGDERDHRNEDLPGGGRRQLGHYESRRSV